MKSLLDLTAEHPSYKKLVDTLDPGREVVLQQGLEHQRSFGLVRVLKAAVVHQVVGTLRVTYRQTSTVVRVHEANLSRVGFGDPRARHNLLGCLSH